MSDEYIDSYPRTGPIHSDLKDFVESAIADTPGLSDAQAEAIRVKVAGWYFYYGRNLSWLKLDFADTEETRWNHQYFRETLTAFVDGIDTLDHVFYSIEMVMIAFLKEHTRLAIEERLNSERNLQHTSRKEPDKDSAAQAEDLSPEMIERAEPPAQKKSPRQTKKSPPPAEQPSLDQFSLFG
jgi:hypothetical protein